jgi:hypothetical protein
VDAVVGGSSRARGRAPGTRTRCREVAGPAVPRARRCRVVGGEMVGRDDVRADSLLQTGTSREEVRPMNAVSMWVLPLVVTVGRLT